MIEEFPIEDMPDPFEDPMTVTATTIPIVPTPTVIIPTVTIPKAPIIKKHVIVDDSLEDMPDPL